jgi:peptidoglycan/LPS O-acetylase OafA/YrhL
MIPPATEPATHRQRVQFLDAARGSAMFFVLLSHFGFTFFPNQADTLPAAMRFVGMVASPTFMVLSGLILGFLYRTSPGSFERLRIKLADRGLFLLTVGHLVLLASHQLYTWRFFHITDTIGVCMLVQPWVVSKLRPRDRLVLSAALFLGSWAVVECWLPAGPTAHLLKETLFGSLTAQNYYRFAFPLVPWFSLDLAATSLGDYVGGHYLRGDDSGIQRLLMRIASAALLAAASGRAIYHVLLRLMPGNSAMIAAGRLSSLFQKQPPGLLYIFFYGAIGLWLVAGCMFLERTGHLRRQFAFTTMLGRTSLFVFLFHWFVYLIAILSLRDHLPFAWAWPVYFVASAVLVTSSAAAWYRLGFNRFITVGYPRLYESILQWRLAHLSAEPSASEG